MTSLENADFASQTWTRLREYITARIADLQIDLESDAMSELTTAKVRGRISELRGLLALATDPAKEPDAYEAVWTGAQGEGPETQASE